LTRIALMNAARVRMSEGLRSAAIISTICLPVRYATSWRSRSGAGMAAEPGSDMPSASVRLFIVVAVPIVLQ
jgi:hypothetical protein